jgi:hypothetical protein
LNLNRVKLIFIAASICLCVHRFAQAQEGPSLEGQDPINSRFFSVLEELFPIEEELGFSLGYRSYRDLHTEELEYSFVLNRIIKEKYLTAVVRMADGVSLYHQLRVLHRKSPGVNIEATKPQLKIKEWRLTEETCPAIRQRHDDFYRLSLTMLSAEDRAREAKGELMINLHPRVHTLKADISGGNMELVLTESEHPYIRWAEETRRAFEGCAIKQSKR